MHDHPTESMIIASDRESRPVRARLRAIAPRGVTWRLDLGASPATIGRTPEDGSPPLIHGTVSRRHTRLFWDAGPRIHVAEDLGSRHGTHVDGVPAGTGTPLRDGSIVRLGGVFLAYERLDADSDDPAGAAIRDGELPGDSAEMARLRVRVARAAIDPAHVLVVGATGTGKEWVARELHRLSGRRGALVPVNCAALSPQLVESQLFGHVKGAFTGAAADADGVFRAAHQGTLFLDEVGELPLELQPKLLRVLQDGVVTPIGGTRSVEVDVRVVAATHRDLAAMVEAGTFRRDLLARLARLELRVPSLASRRGDVLLWLDRLWRAWCTARGVDRPLPELSAAATAVVLAHDWPDNLRGVDRLVHTLAGGASVPSIDEADLPDWLRSATPAAPAEGTPPSVKMPVPTREEFEAAWKELAGNVRALGRRFGRDRRQIYRWAEAYGLRTSDD